MIEVREHCGAYRALELLPRPNSQTPQLITLIGGQRKSSFITERFPLKSSENHKKILLRNVPRYFNTEAPLIITDCELHNSPAPTTIFRSACETVSQFPLLLRFLMYLSLCHGGNA
jgi:hypothetical protein